MNIFLYNSQLTVKHLKMIHAIADSATVREAAESLKISQPALSSRISDAEQRLGIQLFVRRGRKLAISAAGRMLLRSATRILEELARTEHDLSRLSEGIKQVLRVGLPHYSSFTWLPEAIAEFQTELPGVKLEITAEATRDPLNALYQNDIDVALVTSPNRSLHIDEKRVRSIRLFRDEMVASLPIGHAKATEQFLIAEDFVGEIYITNAAIPEKNREYELFFQPQGITPRKVIQVAFNEAILELVKAGMGITIMTRWVLDTHASHAELSELPLTRKGLYINWFAVFAREKKIQAAASLLAKTISEHHARTYDG